MTLIYEVDWLDSDYKTHTTNVTVHKPIEPNSQEEVRLPFLLRDSGAKKLERIKRYRMKIPEMKS